MKILLRLAWRNLWRKKRRTLITVSSVLFAVILAISMMSLLTGTREIMVETIISNTTGHLQVQDTYYHDEPSMDHSMEYTEDIREIISNHSDGISYTVPRIEGFCLGAKDMGTRGVYLMGIVPEKEEKMNGLVSRLVEGEMFTDEDDFVVIASGVADLLDLSVGDTMVLLGQGFQGMTAAGQFRVGGIVRFPVPEPNNTMVYLPLKKAQWFFAAPERLSRLILMTENENLAGPLAKNLRTELDKEWYAVKTWEELMPDAVAALDARNAQVKIFAWVLYIVAGFGIFGTIITMMYERLREFGILLSIGLKRSQLALLCTMETIIISILGVIAGMAVGLPITHWFNKNPIPLSGDLADVMLDLGFEPIMPFSTDPGILIYQAVTIFFIALVVGIYPVKKIYSMEIISATKK